MNESSPTTLPTLYLVNGSIPSWQVMCALHEKQIPFQAHRLRVMTTPRETHSPEFLAINPRGEAPVWCDPDKGVTLRESMAILMYLESHYRQVPLLPEHDARASAAAFECMFDIQALRAAYRPLEQLFRGADALTSPEKTRAASAPDRVQKELIVWEHKLHAHDFMVGDVLTLADCVVYPVLSYMVRRGLTFEQDSRLARYVAHMSARPASLDAHPEGWTQPAGKMNLFARARELEV